MYVTPPNNFFMAISIVNMWLILNLCYISVFFTSLQRKFYIIQYHTHGIILWDKEYTYIT
jgi:hypothetical protein